MDNSRVFVNELGNGIQLRVLEKDIEDIPGILIAIAGPTSDTELHITRGEAEILREQLCRVLDGNKSTHEKE